jgi:hypothetical protein
MKLSSLAPFAIVATLVAIPAAQAQETHAGRINAIGEHYHTLKQMANTEGYWQIMQAARENHPQFGAWVGRANLMMNEIAEGTYDGDIRAQAELTICAGKDIGWVMYNLRGDNELMTNMGRAAQDASYFTEIVTREGNIRIQRDCGTVFDSRIPR